MDVALISESRLNINKSLEEVMQKVNLELKEVVIGEGELDISTPHYVYGDYVYENIDKGIFPADDDYLVFVSGITYSDVPEIEELLETLCRINYDFDEFDVDGYLVAEQLKRALKENTSDKVNVLCTDEPINYKLAKDFQYCFRIGVIYSKPYFFEDFDISDKIEEYDLYNFHSLYVIVESDTVEDMMTSIIPEYFVYLANCEDNVGGVDGIPIQDSTGLLIPKSPILSSKGTYFYPIFDSYFNARSEDLTRYDVLLIKPDYPYHTEMMLLDKFKCKYKHTFSEKEIKKMETLIEKAK